MEEKFKVMSWLASFMKPKQIISAWGLIVLFVVSYIIYSIFLSHHIIYYSYNGVTITRIDKDNGEYYFLYGRYNYFTKGGAIECIYRSKVNF